MNFELLTNPVEYKGQDGILTGLKCIRMELGEPVMGPVKDLLGFNLSFGNNGLCRFLGCCNHLLQNLLVSARLIPLNDA